MTETTGIQGERVRLVPLEAELHLANYVRWLNDPEIARYLGRVKPLGRLEEEAFFARLASARDDIVWAVHDESDRHIGGTGLHGIDWVGRSATSGLVIGDKALWGRGYGKETLRLATGWAFESLGLHRLMSECFVENVASARCIEAAGYRRIGVSRKRYWREGRWHDGFLWEMLEEDWLASRPTAEDER